MNLGVTFYAIHLFVTTLLTAAQQFHFLQMHIKQGTWDIGSTIRIALCIHALSKRSH